jgi:hypothetical protein
MNILGEHIGNPLGTRREHVGNNKSPTPTPFQTFSFDNLKKPIDISENKFLFLALFGCLGAKNFHPKKRLQYLGN